MLWLVFHVGLLRFFAQRWKCTHNLKILQKLPCPQSMSCVEWVTEVRCYLDDEFFLKLSPKSCCFSSPYGICTLLRGCTAVVTLGKRLGGSWRCQSCQILFLRKKSQAELLLHQKYTSGTFSNGYDFIEELRGTKVSDLMMVFSF